MEDQQRANQYLIDQAAKHEAAAQKKAEQEQNKYNRAKAKDEKNDAKAQRAEYRELYRSGSKTMAENKREAKRVAKKAHEAFGISEYDAYEVILEALCEEDYSADEDLASAIEAMF